MKAEVTKCQAQAEVTKCQAQVPERPQYIYYHRCSRNAKVEVAGLRLCKAHGADLAARIERNPDEPLDRSIPYGWGVNMPKVKGPWCRYGDCS